MDDAPDTCCPTEGHPSPDTENPDADELPAELPAWQKEILDERLADLERNPDDGQPWEEIRAELLGDGPVRA